MSYTKVPWLFRGKSDSVHERSDTHPYGRQIFRFDEDEMPSDAYLSLILASPVILEALEAMCAEFRGYDLPYGSEAYAKAISAINQAKGALQ